MVGKTTGSYKILNYNWGNFDLKITWYALLTKLHHCPLLYCIIKI